MDTNVHDGEESLQNPGPSPRRQGGNASGIFFVSIRVPSSV